MLWRPWRRIPEVETRSISISDPALAAYFRIGGPSFAGVPVGEGTALGISAVWRAVSLIAGTIASLPLKTFRDTAEGERQQVTSVFDDPGGPDGPTAYEWCETILWHLLLHSEAYLIHQFNQAGALIGLIPVHPLAVTPEWERDTEGRLTGRKTFTATLDDGQRRVFTPKTMTQLLGPSLDGLTGVSVITMARNSLGTAIAGDWAAGKMFGSGGLIAGLVTPEEDVDEDEAKIIKAGLDAKVSGWENAGAIAFVNRKLKFSPWTMSAEDAQFLQSRQFSVEEVARWFGVPPFQLMQTEKQTSWGTGIEAQQRGLARGPLLGWTTRMEQRFSRLLPAPRFVEFEFAGLERPTPEQEIELLIKQVEAGILTKDEARAIRNLPPLPNGAGGVLDEAMPEVPADAIP